MKKIINAFLIFTLLICVMWSPVSAASKDAADVTPRLVETWTATGVNYHGSSGNVQWTCGLSWDSRTGQTTLTSINSKLNFPANPTYKISTYTVNPPVGKVVSGNQIKVVYYIFIILGTATGPHTAVINI